MAFDIIFTHSFVPLTPTGGNLTVPAAAEDVWDFDETSVSWDTDTSHSTLASLNSAIATALTQGTTASPQHHRFTWTGGNLTGNFLVTGGTAPFPDKYGPHILIQGNNANITGSLSVGTNCTNVKFINFNQSATDRDAINMDSSPAGARAAFKQCNFTGPGSSAGNRRVFGSSSASRNKELSLYDCEASGWFEFIAGWAGYYSVQHCLVRGLIDDFFGGTVRSQAPNICYLYAVGNVVCDMNDDPADGTHCDFVQAGVPTDSFSDAYHYQVYGNVYIGDTYRSYATMASIIQNEGNANRLEMDFQDNIFMTTGTRGHWQPDRRFTCKRNMYLWPPLEGAVPTTGTGWQGGPYRQFIRSTGTLGTNDDIDIGPYWAAQNAQNTSGWGTLPNPDQIADHTAALGGSTSYDTLFPNMTGLVFSGSTLIIDNGWAGVTRTRQAIREWIGEVCLPSTTANGSGWAANGFNNPANWFTA